MKEEDNPNPSVTQCPNCGSLDIKNATVSQPLGNGRMMTTPAHSCRDCLEVFTVTFYAGAYTYIMDDE